MDVDDIDDVDDGMRSSTCSALWRFFDPAWKDKTRTLRNIFHPARMFSVVLLKKVREFRATACGRPVNHSIVAIQTLF